MEDSPDLIPSGYTMINEKIIDCILRDIILRRAKPSMLSRILILLTQFWAPERLNRIWNSLGTLRKHSRVTILAFSDSEPNVASQIRWGDYWFKYEMTKAVGTLGFGVVSENYCPDIVLHLFGQPVDLSSFGQAYKILWIHSNPDRITPELSRQYDRIFCISDMFADYLRKMGFVCEVVQQGTSKRHLFGLPKRYDVVFVGNARSELGGMRQVVTDIGEPDYNFKVWGTGYHSLPSKYWAGEYIDYHALSELYASSCISLNDHRPAMSAKGFINPRVFDILAAGGFCISDFNHAITELFGDAVPQYTSASHLRELVTHFLAHPDERDILAQKGRAIAVQYSWDNVATTLFTGISPKYEK